MTTDKLSMLKYDECGQWESEKMYSESEVLDILQHFCNDYDNVNKLEDWFQAFKKNNH